MKKLLLLTASLLIIGCNWGSDACSCGAECCDSGACGTEDCNCSCKWTK